MPTATSDCAHRTWSHTIEGDTVTYLCEGCPRTDTVTGRALCADTPPDNPAGMPPHHWAFLRDVLWCCSPCRVAVPQRPVPLCDLSEHTWPDDSTHQDRCTVCFVRLVDVFRGEDSASGTGRFAFPPSPHW